MKNGYPIILLALRNGLLKIIEQITSKQLKRVLAAWIIVFKLFLQLVIQVNASGKLQEKHKHIWLLFQLSVLWMCFGSGWMSVGSRLGCRNADKDLASTCKLRPCCTQCSYLKAELDREKRRKPKLIFRLKLQADTSRYIY